MFKLWSEVNPESLKSLKPDFGLRHWASVSKEEKKLIWKYLEVYFFNPNEKESYSDYYSGLTESYFEFYGDDQEEKRERIYVSIGAMNVYYKTKNYTPNFIENNDWVEACKDFYAIFSSDDDDAVLELLSFYCKALIKEKENKVSYIKSDNQTEVEFQKEILEGRVKDFNEFKDVLNDVFLDFGIYVHLTENGFMPRQEERIINDIYEPVLKILKDSKWEEVNFLLYEAFNKYRENTPSGYSTCVTHTVAAVEAFLQITVRGKAGEGDFAGLISEGQRNELIPNDVFTREAFKTIVSVLMTERKETGDAHVKKSYATEKNAKMVLNLAMVFIQHCIRVN